MTSRGQTSAHTARLRAGNDLTMLMRTGHHRVMEYVQARLEQMGFNDVRPAHMAIFQNLGPDGARIGELAERAKLTNQSVGYLVDYLEQHGYVERRPDPTNRRATLVCFTERGWDEADACARILDDLDQELTSRVGRGQIAATPGPARRGHQRAPRQHLNAPAHGKGPLGESQQPSRTGPPHTGKRTYPPDRNVPLHRRQSPGTVQNGGVARVGQGPAPVTARLRPGPVSPWIADSVFVTLIRLRWREHAGHALLCGCGCRQAVPLGKGVSPAG